jgi:hypothetical protein
VEAREVGDDCPVAPLAGGRKISSCRRRLGAIEATDHFTIRGTADAGRPRWLQNDAAMTIAILALIAALIVPLGIERLKRPRLDIIPSPWTPSRPVAWTFAAVRIRNLPLRGLAGMFMTRGEAQGCRVEIDFTDLATGTRPFDTVQGRWSSHPEPLQWVPNPPLAAIPGIGGTAIPAPGTGGFAPAFDPSLIRHEQDVAVSKDGEEVPIAVLRAGDAYAWTSSSYGYPIWADPNLHLPHGTYRVDVRVQGSNVDHSQSFKLEYLNTDFTKFRLQPV